MWKLCVPDHVFEKLRCSLCKGYLSNLPVYIYPGNGDVRCSRCPILTDQNPIRNTPYEIVVEYLSFPCRYKPYGCLENILSIHMAAHEESCAFKQYFCPVVPLASCSWQGTSSELFNHYQEFHPALALKDSSFEIDLVTMYENNFLFNQTGELFIVQTKCEMIDKKKIFWCGVHYIGSKAMAEKFIFQLEFEKHGENETIKLCQKPMQYDEIMKLDKARAVHVETEEIKKSLENPCSIICNIKILQNENLLSSGDFTNKTTTISEDTDGSILLELECPICNEYMVPPIHQCVAGHSICGSCKEQVSKCPICRDKIQSTRNFSLERMTRFIKYCCKYRDYGCYFVSSSEHIRQHEANCRFGPYDCPFLGYNNCKWKGSLGNIMKHARDEHEDNILENENLVWHFEKYVNENSDKRCYLLQFQGEIFKLIFKYENKTFFWSMQYVGLQEKVSNYMFELDIYDNIESNQRLFIKRYCNPCTPCSAIFNEEDIFVQIPLIVIKPLLQNGDLVYKCRVVKKILNI